MNKRSSPVDKRSSPVDKRSSPVDRRSYSQILDRVARDGLAEHTDLAPRIMARIQKGKSATMQPSKKIFVAVFLILLVLMIGLVSVPSVRAAIQRWIGYAPGIGLVSEGQIRVLAEPVSVTREGITLTVEEVWAASDRTLIQFSVEGWPWGSLVTEPPADGCLDPALLRLPDRDLTITQPQSTSGWATGYALKSLYPAIPTTVDEVTFVMPCLILASPGEAPEDWELSLRLVPALPDAVFPVIEISTPVEGTPTVPSQSQTNTGLAIDGVSLVLDRAIQMDDGYLIYATLHYENTGLSSIDLPDPTALHLLDANGQEVSYELDWDATNEIQSTFIPGQTAFAIRTAAIQSAGPLTLVLDSISASVATDARFTFDPGPDPKPGQVWELNEEINLGYGQSVRVLSVTYNLTDGTRAWLSFEMKSETGVMDAGLVDKAHPLNGGGGGGGSYSPGPFTSALHYPESLPEEPLTVDIIGISTIFPGHWEAAWTPPEPQAQVMPTAQLSACLTRVSWQEALQAHASLPAGLSGTLALAAVPPPDYYDQVSVAKLDGSSTRSIGFGSAPSLSPDGTRVVYMGPAVDGPADGLYITDLASGNTSRLPGTSRGDMNPLWSPDGQKIAFTRGPSSGLIGAPGPYNIVVTNVDGSDLHLLTEGVAANYGMAWMPDGKRILYTITSRDGASLHLMDVQTGEVRPLFDINYNGTVAVSPDGNRLAFEEMLPLDKYGLFVSDLDGSNRKLLADGDPYTVTVPAWSPDGNWVIASVHDPDASTQPNPILALIQVDTCQIVPVPSLSGYVSSWLP